MTLINLNSKTWLITVVFLLFYIPNKAHANPALLMIKDPGVMGCSNKSDSNSCTIKLGWGQRVLATQEQFANRLWEKNEWFEVKTELGRGAGKVYWIKSEHLISTDRLEKITYNWPVRFIYYHWGHGSFRYDFDKYGKTKVTIEYDNKVERFDGEVVMSPGPLPRIGLIRHLGSEGSQEVTTIGLNDKGDIYVRDRIKGEEYIAARFDDKKRALYSGSICLLDCPSKRELAQLNKVLRYARAGNANKIKEFVSKGGDVNVQLPVIYDGSSTRPNHLLMIAAKRWDYRTVKYLLEHGANVDVNGFRNETALSYAVASLYPPGKLRKDDGIKTLAYLLEAGANVEARKDGYPALVEATIFESKEFVSLLLQYGADVNTVRTYDGHTSLIRAVMKDNIDIADMLLVSGADLKIKNRRNKTAIDYVKSEKMKFLIDK